MAPRDCNVHAGVGVCSGRDDETRDMRVACAGYGLSPGRATAGPDVVSGDPTVLRGADKRYAVGGVACGLAAAVPWSGTSHSASRASGIARIRFGLFWTITTEPAAYTT